MSEYEIMVALNGARRQKQDHPALPLSTQEIAQHAAACHREGAGALHLHVRDAEGGHSLDAGRYREAIAAVQAEVPTMAIQITTESAGRYSPNDQLACLKVLRPVAASISVRELARAPEIAANAYAICRETGTQVQHILYDDSCVAQLRQWYQAGVVPGDMRDAIFVLGKYAPPVFAKPQDLQVFLTGTADMNLNWSLCAFGRAERTCLLAGIAAGGNVRIGFENNIETPESTLLIDNAASVAALVQAAEAAGHHLRKG